MTKTQKRIDAVQLMRTLRDSLSEQMRDTTFEQQREFIEKRLRSDRPQPAQSR
jgi:CRISPR/Cas system type I-B associated protein Csh2 (Cas7 group RAMP superfamily)